MIEDEEASDKQLREQFKEKWSRTPSSKLTQPMRDESMKYKQILDTAINADRTVQEKFQKHKHAIEMLSKSPVRSSVILSAFPALDQCYWLLMCPLVFFMSVHERKWRNVSSTIDELVISVLNSLKNPFLKWKMIWRKPVMNED